MSDDIITQHPDHPRSGASIIKGSMSGRKNQFIRQSSVGTGSLSIPAGGSGWINILTDIYPPQLSETITTLDDILEPDDAVVWVEADFYIDVDNDTDYRWNNGASLSNDQLGVIISQVEAMSASFGESHHTQFKVFNNGADPHTVYYGVRARCIITGDSEL